MNNQSIRRASLLAATLAILIAAFASQASAAVVPNHYIVVFKDSVQKPGNLAHAQVEQKDGELGFVYRHALKGYSAELSKGDVKALRDDPRVKFVAPDHIVEIASQTVPTGVRRTFAAANQGLEINEDDDLRVDADVAVIDTGIDYDHPDLDVVAHTSCLSETCVDGIGTDDNSHGTHVAGTIGALDNGIGVVGVAPGARLWAVKVLDAAGFGSDSKTAAGIDWVTAHAEEIEVANMSLGCSCSMPATAAAIEGSVDAGVVYVVAAGNASSDAGTFAPANHPDVITVSALADYDGWGGGKASYTCSDRGPDDTLASFSNFGKSVEVAAPGVCILSTVPGGGYSSNFSGTSMASPHVAGAAAILASGLNPETRADVEEIREAIEGEGKAAEEAKVSTWTDTSGDGEQEPLLYLGKTEGLLDTPPVFSFAFGAEGSDNGQFNHPTGIATDSEGNVWVADSNNNRIQKFDPEGEFLAQFGSYGSGSGQLDGPEALAIDAKGNVWVSDTSNNRVQKFNPEGKYLSQFGSEGSGNGQFSYPEGIALDSAGNLWVLDTGNNRIQKFNPEGKYLSQFGSLGSDHGQFNYPAGIAVDSTGYLWVADSGNGRVQRLNVKGEYLSQLGGEGSGSGQLGYPTGIDVDPQGHVWVIDSAYNRVQGFLPEGKHWNNFGAEGSGNGQFNYPTGIAIDQEGDLWITDAENNRVQEWDAVGAPAAGTEAAIAITASAATLNGVIDPNGMATTYQFEYGTTTSYGSKAPLTAKAIGSGTKTVAVSEKLSGLKAGTTYHFRVLATNEEGTTQGEDRTFTTAAPLATTEAASAIGTSEATLNGTVNPNGLEASYQFEYGLTTSYGSKAPLSAKAIGSGSSPVAVSEKVAGLKPVTLYHYRVTATSKEGTVHGKDQAFETKAIQPPSLAFSFGESGEASGQLTIPVGVATDAKGNVWVADTGNHRVQKFNSEGKYLSQFGSEGSGNGQLRYPSGIAIDSSGSLWVADLGNNRVQKFNSEGKYLSQFGSYGSGSGQLDGPEALAIDAKGNVWVSDTSNNRVQKFNPEGKYLSQFGSQGSGNGQFTYPSGIAIDASGNAWVADLGNNRVQKFSSEGKYLSQFGSYGSGNGQLYSPSGLAIDPSGNLWITDRDNYRVQGFNSEGKYLAQFGSYGLGEGELNSPYGIAADPSGDLWVADTLNDRVQKWAFP